jgi:hypothetical protein
MYKRILNIVISVMIICSLKGYAKTPNEPEKSFGVYDTMPVELIYFTATVDSTGILLNWGTATEINNYGFNVERAGGNLSWVKIGFVQGSGTSSSTKHYHFFDTTVKKNNTYYYKLRQIDNDGKSTYSDSIIVNNILSVNKEQNKDPKGISLLSNFPNPFNPSTTIIFNLQKQEEVTLNIYDVAGRLVENLINNKFMDIGEHKINYINKGLASGVYYYTLKTASIVKIGKLSIVK